MNLYIGLANRRFCFQYSYKYGKLPQYWPKDKPRFWGNVTDYRNIKALALLVGK